MPCATASMNGNSMMDFLKNYWPFFALGAWFLYKNLKSRQVVAMMPRLKEQGAVLVDVRSPAEFSQGSAPGTVNIPLQDLGARMAELPKNAPIVVGCASGSRSGMARMTLRRNGFARVYNIGAWTNFLR